MRIHIQGEARFSPDHTQRWIIRIGVEFPVPVIPVIRIVSSESVSSQSSGLAGPPQWYQGGAGTLCDNF